ncbi:MAG: hypothetical protein Q9225_006787 [Loekoesia sp. 1 TL-2023]
MFRSFISFLRCRPIRASYRPMTTTTFADIPDINDIVDRVWWWIRQSGDGTTPLKIAAAYHQRGGWEGWAQVEIAYAIQQKYEKVALVREVKVFEGTGQAADFVITHRTDHTQPVQIVELKCERGSLSGNQFGALVASDIRKIQTSPLRADFKPATVYVVAISVTQDGLRSLRGVVQTSIQVIGDIWVSYHVQNIGVANDRGGS